MQKFRDLPYERPDIAAIGSKAEALVKKLAGASSYEEARSCLMEKEELFRSLSTLETIAQVRNTINTTDAFYEAEMEYLDGNTPKLIPVLKDWNQTLLLSPYRPEFEKEFGTQLFRLLEAETRAQDPAIIEDRVEEANLCTEYSKLTATCSTIFRGETCNFYGLLKHMHSVDRAERKEAFEAWAALYESIADRLDDIYDRMIAVRCRMAEKLGMKSYCELAYIDSQKPEFTPEMIASFRQQVKEVITPAADKLRREQAKRLGIDKLRYYDEPLFFPDGNAEPHGTPAEMIEAARQMYHELSEETGEFFDFMTRYDLFDLESKPGKRTGGYCTALPGYKAAFIFSNFNGTSADVDVLTHEAGHAFMVYNSMRRFPLDEYIWSNFSIDEIHSMSMELFTYPWMDKFFGQNAEKYRYGHLRETLCSIPYLVSVDEFQHRVFENPKMSAKERRAVWREIEKAYMPWRDYGGNAFLEEGGFWMQKQHIFLNPFYYVDYALAQMGAFDFYTKMKENREKAWQDYYTLCCAGGSRGYFELLDLAGLHNPFLPGSVAASAKAVLEEVAE